MKTARKSLLAAVVSGALLTPLICSSASAQTLIEGLYISPAGDNGRGACTLQVKSLGRTPKYGDEVYSIQSTGEGSCEWTAVGLAKNFGVAGGLVTSGGYTGFVSLEWPFGPGGKQLDLVSFNTDGSPRNKQTFTRD